jgi:hypothetical protein
VNLTTGVRFNRPDGTNAAAKSEAKTYVIVLLGGEAGPRCGEMMLSAIAATKRRRLLQAPPVLHATALQNRKEHWPLARQGGEWWKKWAVCG